VGCPVAAVSPDEVPDFAARAKDPALGAPLPEGKLYDGPRRLHFDGYSTTPDGVPTFRYRVEDARGDQLGVRERVEPLRSPVGVGLRRHFTLLTQPNQAAWLLLAEGTEPRVLDARGAALSAERKEGRVVVPAEGRWLVLSQGPDRVVLLSLTRTPPG